MMAGLNTMSDSMLLNLQSERADQFDEGVRQAAAFARVLQDIGLTAGRGIGSQQLVETAVTVISRVLEAGLEQRNNVSRRNALQSIAGALAQALVPCGLGSSSGVTALSLPGSHDDETQQRLQAMTKVIEEADECSDGDWGDAWIRSSLLLLRSNGSCSGGPLGDVKKVNFKQHQNNTVEEELAHVALHVPVRDILSGNPSQLISEYLQRCARTGEAWSSSGIQSSACTAAHFILNPKALTACLSEMLQASLNRGTTTTAPVVTLSSLQETIASRADFKQSMDSISSSPVLLLCALRTLRAWLAESGNVAAWLLHSELANKALQSNAESIITHLYPAFLESAAQCAHVNSWSSGRGVEAAEVSVEELGAAVHEMHLVLQKCKKESTLSKRAAMEDEVWAVLLNSHCMNRVALDLVPWSEVARWAGLTFEHEKNQQQEESSAGGAPEAVAEWLALLMWPFSSCESHRKTFCDVLTGVGRGRNRPTLQMQESLQVLHSWQVAWRKE